MNLTDFTLAVESIMTDIALFSHAAGGIKLRAYQEEVARAIINSVLHQRGLTFVVIFPRQSGKNELQAQIEAYLLLCFQQDGECVKISPTWKPQSLNAMRRLERALEANALVRLAGWKKEQGYVYRVGSSRLYFLSGAPTAHIVGATASVLLECDEAQDVQIAKWDKEVAPMAASTNATRVFWGTAWTSQTLLAREKQAALEAQKADGIRRVFILDADAVAQEVPAYGKFVAEQVRRLGRRHPFVRTQFYSQEVDAESGMFPPGRVALMKGSHSLQTGPVANHIYAFLIDVAGEDEGVAGAGVAGLSQPVLEHPILEYPVLEHPVLEHPGRAATALTLVEVDLSSLSDPLLQAPLYRVVNRKAWLGEKHSTIYAQLLALGELWQPRWIVVDATGVGAGLASFLEKAFVGRVLPFVFNSSSKSKLGWGFLAVVETGRFSVWKPSESDGFQSMQLADQFWREVESCQMEILPGPERRMKWGVPDGTRHPSTGELVHDDLLVSASLCAVLDDVKWGVGESRVVEGFDPLAGMGEVFNANEANGRIQRIMLLALIIIRQRLCLR